MHEMRLFCMFFICSSFVYSTVYSRRWSKKTSKRRVTGFCEGNSSVTGEFPTQRASNAENVSIWWRHHDMSMGMDTLPSTYVWQPAWKSTDINIEHYLYIRSQGYIKSASELLHVRAHEFSILYENRSFNIWLRYFVWNFEYTLCYSHRISYSFTERCVVCWKVKI